MTNHQNKLLPYLMWLLTLSFFAYQFVLRLAPGLIVNDLTTKYNILAADIGFMSAMYYLGYAGMQIPVAILLDRYRPNLVIVGCIILASLGMIVTAYAEEWWMVVAARFVVGFGSAAGFLGVSKIVQLFFSKAEYAKMIGFSFTIGLMGALYGGRPVSTLLEQMNYHELFSILGFIGFAIAALLLVLFRLPRSYRPIHEPIWQNLKQVISNKQILMLALANLLLVGTLEGFADVWGVNFFMQQYHLSKVDAATFTSLIFVGMLFGGPVLAIFAKAINSEVTTIALTGMVTAIVYLVLFMITDIHLSLLSFMMIVLGIMCCYQVLVFSVGNNLVDSNLQSITIAFLNSINMFGGSFFHILIGSVLSYLGYEKTNALVDYKIALSSIPIAAIIGMAIILAIEWANKLRTANTRLKQAV